MSEKISAKSWWTEVGCFKLNDIMINIIGERIGYVPLENLLDVSSFDPEELIPLLIKDGCTLKKVDYVDGTYDLYIYVK